MGTAELLVKVGTDYYTLDQAVKLRKEFDQGIEQHRLLMERLQVQPDDKAVDKE